MFSTKIPAKTNHSFVSFMAYIVNEIAHGSAFKLLCTCMCICRLALQSLRLCVSNRRAKEGSDSVNFSISSSAEGEVER